jgi:hypothetical protein
VELYEVNMEIVIYCRSCNTEIEPESEMGEYYKTKDGVFHIKNDCDEVETQ